VLSDSSGERSLEAALGAEGRTAGVALLAAYGLALLE